MAITTADGVIAGAVAGGPPIMIAKGPSGARSIGRPYTYWPLNGIPGAGTYDTTLNGVVLDSTSTPVNGQIPFRYPGSGKCYLGRILLQTLSGGTFILADRIWHNGGFTITSTGVQSITSPTWPARDNNGSTNGEGILLALEVSATTGAAGPNLSVIYTNSAGTGSRTAAAAGGSLATGSQSQSFYLLNLQAGDIGVRSVQSLQLSASWISGTMNLVAYRILAVVGCSNGSIPAELNTLTGSMVELHQGTVPFLVDIAVSASASTAYGSINYLHG